MDNTIEEDKREVRLEMGKQRGRKSGKLLQKKQPQRGLGVAQLERLRLQERWKKRIADINGVQALQKHQLPFQIPLTFLHHNHSGVSVPFMNLAPAKYGSMNDAQTSNVCPPHWCDNGGLVDSDRLRIYDEEARFKSLNLLYTAKELSSTQITHCLSDYCEICFEKKHINGGEILGFHGDNSKITEIVTKNGYDHLKLSLGRNRSIDGEINNEIVYSRRNPNKEVKILGVHRKGNCAVEGSVLMEYEFFPCKGSSNSSNKDSSVTDTTERAVVGEEASPANTNLLELSLKLSC